MTEVKKVQSEIIPKRFLQGLVIIICLVLCSVFIYKLIDLPMMGIPPKSAVDQERKLKFFPVDRTNVAVYFDDSLLTKSSDEGNGFIGVVYNAIKRERIKQRIEENGSLRLVRYTNGRLVLIDDSTSLEIQLNSFGNQNAEVFGSLMMVKK